MSNETEQAILNSLGEGDEHEQEQLNEDQLQDETEDSSSTEEAASNEEGSGTDTDDSASAESQQKEQLTEQAHLSTTDRLYSDSKGNLVDGKGNIVATAGPNRRLFEKSQKLEQSNKILIKQSQDLQNQLKGVQTLNNLPQQLGLSLPEVDSALRLMQAFKANPSEAIKSIIVQARANGVNIDLGDGTGQALDTQAISAMIDNKLSPLVQGHQAQEQYQQLQQQVEAEVATFYSTYPDAIVHADTIAKLITEANHSPSEAYWRLKSWIAENQLDWSRSVEEQIAERQRQVRSNQQQQQQSPRPNSKPRVNGSSMAANANTDDAGESFNATSSWSSIINKTLESHGFKQ